MLSFAVRVARTWNQKQADLNPPLGYPGGPCYLIERILSKKLGPKGEYLISLVEEGEDLDQKDAKNSFNIYTPFRESRVPGTSFEWLGFSSHAQYRMDLRGVTIGDVRAALIEFQQEFAKEKSRKSPWWERTQKAIQVGEEIRWSSKKLGGLVVGFTANSVHKSPGIFVQTVYYLNDKVPRVNRKDCKSWDKWVEQTPKPTQLEKIFEGKTGSLYLKKRAQEDLYPPLGYPGGPCQVLERIRDEVPNPNLQEVLVDSVEQGQDLSNPQASKIYKVIVTQGVPGTPTEKIILTNHAQYRMDLRGITIPQIRASLRNFWKSYHKEKSLKSPLYREWETQMSWGEGIRWEDLKSGFTLVFEPRKNQAFVVTLFWTKFTKPPLVDESKCEYDKPLPAESYFSRAAMKSGPEPVQTFVNEKSQQNLPTDIDRTKQVVLPPGSATPGSGGRDIPRVEYNTPDSGSNISERPRTLGVPGEQYGVPYKEDYNMPTRRTMTSRVLWDYYQKGR